MANLDKGVYVKHIKVWIGQYPSGKKREEGVCVNDQQTGKWTYWYENGQKDEEGVYVHGKRTGKWTKWFDNGQKRWEGVYDTGKLTGVWTMWKMDGSEFRTFDYGSKTPDILVSASEWQPRERIVKAAGR